MVENLLIGLPGERPGGLVLSILYFVSSGIAALIVGFVYAALGVALPRASLPLQAASALLRGVPLLLLVFLTAQVPDLPTKWVGFVGLVLYSFAHVGETLRSFLASYPSYLIEQAHLIGLTPGREWLQLRLPWTLWRAWRAVGTHWISLLKDTGALVVLGIGELTTVAKILSESTATSQDWLSVLAVAAALYLTATLGLVQALNALVGRPGRLLQREERHG